MADATPRGTLGTVLNAARILDELSAGPPFQPLSELAERCDMPLPTVHRLLRSLVVAGLAQQDQRTSWYGLGAELVRLSAQYLSRLPLLTAAGPYLVELRNVTKGTVLLAILVRGDVVYIDRVDGEDAGGVFRNATRVEPAVATAAGRVLLAHASESGSPSDGGIELPDEDDLRHWQSSRFLVLSGDDPVTPTEVAAPIRGADGSVSAALAVTNLPPTFTDDSLHDEVTPHLLRTAAAIARALNHG